MSIRTSTTTTLFHRLLSWATPPRHQNQVYHSFIRVFLITAREFRRNELALRASALTYTVLLSLVPLLAVSTALVKGIGGGNHLQQVVYD
jgi:membrane protein